MSAIDLNVILPKNRNPTGRLRLEVDRTPVAEYQCLGRGESETLTLEKSSGPHGQVKLKAMGANALSAQWLGQSGIWIHGGRPCPGSGLRLTGNSLRLSNLDMQDLINQIERAAGASDMCTLPVLVRVTVK